MTSTAVKKTVGVVFAIICGGVFVFSAFSKLAPIEPFEISLTDIGITNWQSAPIVARLFIGMEFIVGFLLLFLFRLRKFTIPLAAIILSVFTIYLLFVIKAYGNTGNCGCFGQMLVMSPLEGILKNLVLLLLLGTIYLWAPVFEFRFKTLIAIVIAILLAISPFLLNRMGNPFSAEPISEYHSFVLNMDWIKDTSDNTAHHPDLRKGKRIFGIFSPTCPHCRVAAKKMAVMKRHDPSLSILFIIYNNPEVMSDFFNDTKSKEIPHVLLNNEEEFIELTRGAFPRIYFVNDSVVEYETNYFLLNTSMAENWLNDKPQ